MLFFSFAFLSILAFFFCRSAFFFGEPQLPDSWGFLWSELIWQNIWCSGIPTTAVSPCLHPEEAPLAVQLYSPKTRSWRRRENIWSTGWRRRTSRLGLGSVSCPSFVGVFHSHVETVVSFYFKTVPSSSPTLQILSRHVNLRGGLQAVGGISPAKKKGGGGHGVCDAAPAKLVRPRTVYVGRRVRLHKNDLWLTAAEWPMSAGILSEHQFHPCALSVDLKLPDPGSPGCEHSALSLV